jgi:glycine betaine catabolism A
VSVPAPIARSALQACLVHFPGGRTLPADAYISSAVFEWEKTNFFEASWVCVGRSADLGEPGDQRAVGVGDEGILLARGGDGALRGFYNTCRHRGHELLPCSGDRVNRGAIQCPYHRWVYGLDGAFKGGPGLATQHGFDRTDPDHGLVNVRTHEWGGWVFVDASGTALDFADHIGSLDSIAEPYECDRLVAAAHHTYELRANWKLIIENYHECYHCAEIHPELCRISSPKSGAGYDPEGMWVGGTMELNDEVETMSLDGSSSGLVFRGLDELKARQVLYISLFPNMLFSFHPDYVMTHRFKPQGPSKTVVECAWLFPPEALEREGFDPSYASEFWDITNRQDWTACESVQRGIAGRGYRQGPLTDSEVQVYQHTVLVARSYLAGLPVGPAPSGKETQAVVGG